MSDTTITAEEREMWASTAAARINAVTPERQCEITAQERLVKALNALEQAEARVMRGETRAETLRKRLMEQVEYTKTILARAEKAEARAEEYKGFIAALVAGLRQRWPRATAAMTCEDCTAGDVFSSVLDPIVLALTERAEKADAELKKGLAHCKFEFDRAEKTEAENARLRAELETAKQVAASAQAVAQEAWAGEIPSPLPGHKRENEEELLAQVEHLNCPLCGGSGHIGDCEGD